MISVADYNELVRLIVLSEDALLLSSNAMSDARDTLDNTRTTALKRGAIEAVLDEASGKLDVQVTDPLPALLNAVAALQRHIVLHYGTLASYYAANSITVPTTFATLSTLAGYPV
jgi:hypothetical protein